LIVAAAWAGVGAALELATLRVPPTPVPTATVAITRPSGARREGALCMLDRFTR